MKNVFFTLFAVLALFVFMVFFKNIALPPDRTDGGTALTNRAFSRGFRTDGSIYYLTDTRIYAARRPLWFIATIGLPAREISRNVSLFRYDTASGKNGRIALLLTNRTDSVNIQYSLFTRSGGLIVFAFLRHERKSGPECSALEIFTWNPTKSALQPVKPGREKTYYEAYFSGVSFPAGAGPDTIPVGELTNLPK